MVSAWARATAARVCSTIFEFVGKRRVPVVTLRLIESLLQQIYLCTRDTTSLNWHIHVSGHDHRGKVVWLPIYEDPSVLRTPVRSVLSSVYHCVESPASLLAVSSAVLGVGRHMPAASSGFRHATFTSGLRADAGVRNTASLADSTLQRSVLGSAAPVDERHALAGSAARQDPEDLASRLPSDEALRRLALTVMGAAAGCLANGPADGSTPRIVVPPHEGHGNGSGTASLDDAAAADGPVEDDPGLVSQDGPMGLPGADADVDLGTSGVRQERGMRKTVAPRQPTCPVSEHPPAVLLPSENVFGVLRVFLSADGRLTHMRCALTKARAAVCNGAYA